MTKHTPREVWINTRPGDEFSDDAEIAGSSDPGPAADDFVCVRYIRADEHDELVAALRRLVERCDGEEGVRADGSNIDTRAAHAALGDFAETDDD